jgi:hypothetical protein
MESSSKVFIDKRVEQTFRKFKESDHIIYLYGIDNNILGTWITDKEDNYSLENFVLSLPSGFKINGVIMIYNENVYEDFDSLALTEIEALKNVDEMYKHLISENIYAFVMKDVLYLDDFDSISFEKNVLIIDGTENEVEVEFRDLYNKMNDKKNYFFLHGSLKLFVNPEKEEGNSLVLNLPEDLSSQNYFISLSNGKLFIDSVEKLQSTSVDHITELMGKINLDSQIQSGNGNKIPFKLGVKSKDGEIKNIENIILKSSDIQGSFSTLLELGGYIPGSNNTFYSLINSFITSIKYFSKKQNLQFERKLSENKIFSSHPIFALLDQNSDKIKNEEVFSKKMNLFTTKFILEKGPKYPITRLVNVDSNIKKDIPQYSKQFTVKGDYEYYHYGQDNMNDKGWGCAYRSLQTLFSWFCLNGFKKEDVNVPSILDIQKTLVKVGDKEAKLIGSDDWIGAFEVSIVLNELLGIESQIIYVSSGADLTSKGRDLAYHFETNGTPVMIGGGVYAYTILGIEYDRVKGDCLFLILDPHYQGEDDVKTIINKGWCEWKTAALFEKGNFYNMCLPQVPK